MPTGVYPRRVTPAATRFWAKVDKSGDCWLWTASVRGSGYANFYFRGRCVNAHRVAWILTHGEVPDGLQVLHDCPGGDNPLCVNPTHLYLGTIRDNVNDMYAKGRSWYDTHPEEARAVLSVRRPQKQVRGEEVGTAKLTREQVLEIRRLFAAGGWTKADLGRAFGVSRMQIYSIVSGKKWRHLSDG